MAFNFINPYNFVPLSSKVGVNEKNDDKTVYSGAITFSLLTKTPLFIPNTSNDHAIYPDEYNKATEKEGEKVYHKSYEFYAYEDLSGQVETKKVNELRSPVIPGSEIRGMLRANYEILTNSCLSSVDEDVVLGRRNAQVYSAGLLYRVEYEVNVDGKKEKKYKYQLYRAEDCLLRTVDENSLEIDSEWADDSSHNERKCYHQNDLKEGQKVYVYLKDRVNCKRTVEKIYKDASNGGIEAYVIKGEDGPKMANSKNQKHCAHVFVKKSVICDNLSEASLESLDLVLKEYDSQGNGKKYEEYRKQYNLFKKQSSVYFPVYYSTINNDYYMLSPASITREIYSTKLSSLLKEYNPCRSREKLCRACSLFGTLNTKSNFAIGSKIRITDMALTNGCDNVYEKEVTLKELSSPKLQNVEFYLKKPDGAVFWTYDYWIDKDGKIKNYNAEINGRKFYWHDLNANVDSAAAGERTEINITVRPVKVGNTFTGKVFFDGISKKELDTLIFMLSLCDDTELKDKKNGYKLGGAKPLGFGSIAVGVESVVVRKLVSDENAKSVVYSETEYDAYVKPDFDSNILDNFMKMTNFEALNHKGLEDYKVSYPALDGKEETEIYKWFVSNHKAYKLDKQSQKKVENKSPNDRKWLYFNEYMKPMNPKLVSTGMAEKIVSKQDKKIGSKPGADKKRQNNNSFDATANTNLDIGKTYDAKITGFNKSGVYAYAKVNGIKVSFNANNRKYEINQIVKVRIKKYNSEYDSYNADAVN